MTERNYGLRVEMMSRLASAITPALLGVLLSGCALLRSGSTDLLTTQEIIDQLRAQGISMVQADRAMQPFFSVSGHTFAMQGGGELQIFEYRSEASATLDASKIESQSRTVTGPPHYYHRENVIAVYTGRDPVVEAALTDILGGPMG